MHEFRWPALVTLGVLVLLFVLAGKVGAARGKFGIKAPATTGHPEFEHAFRAHMNTVENTVMFIPALRGIPTAISLLVFGTLVLGAAWGVLKGFT
jgi:MAPEG family